MQALNENILAGAVRAAYWVHYTAKSQNAKIGEIPATVSERATCPTSCPFYDAGCYAGVGPVSWHWKKVRPGERGGDWAELCKHIAALPENQLWRHNVAGDLPGDGETIDHGALGQLVSANSGKRGFTYTHYPATQQNLAAIHAANRAGFTINLSANNLDHADKLAAHNVAPVVVVLPEHNDGLRLRTPQGRKVAICPATYSDTNCKACQLCQRQDRAVIVGFPAHGAQKSTVDIIARAA